MHHLWGRAPPKHCIYLTTVGHMPPFAVYRCMRNTIRTSKTLNMRKENIPCMNTMNHLELLNAHTYLYLLTLNLSGSGYDT